MFCILLLTATQAAAQTRPCRVLSAVNGAGLASVSVSGLQSGKTFQSDSLGVVDLPVGDPGPFRFSHISYQTRILRADTGGRVWTVTLHAVPYALDGVVVLSPMARYRRDSAFNGEFFRRELADARLRPGKKFVFIRLPRGVELGIEWSGLISNLALVASGKKAQYRRLARAIKLIDAGRFTAIRYTTALVSEQTGLEEDSAMAFIAKHPLDEEFLRSASELELKMRIRELHRGR